MNLPRLTDRNGKSACHNDSDVRKCDGISMTREDLENDERPQPKDTSARITFVGLSFALPLVFIVGAAGQTKHELAFYAIASVPGYVLVHLITKGVRPMRRQRSREGIRCFLPPHAVRVAQRVNMPHLALTTTTQ
jgi:hypothetical protein